MDKKSKQARKKTLTTVYRQSTFVNMRYHPVNFLSLWLYCAIASLFWGCSNSEGIYYAEWDESGFAKTSSNDIEEYNNSPAVQSSDESDIFASSKIIDNLPLDDTEYPYASIPRIVIETEGHREIKDRETEIPAKLQIWGEKAPESEIMELTIRGRGNTSWDTPKKSYKIEFTDKQSILDMPKDRDWALISNYVDKTLMKNYLMYHLSAKLEAYYAPRCEFVELYINNEYLGVYLLTETIKISKNRLNIPQNDNSYIVEFDSKYRDDEQVIFSKILQTNSNEKAFRVHAPKNASTKILSEIQNHITNFELYLKTIHPQKNNQLEQWIDVSDYVKHYWVQEFSKNPDAWFLTSVYFSWIKEGVIRMGPVWDFDLAFGGHANELPFEEYENLSRLEPQGWYTNTFYWNKYLFRDSLYSDAIKQHWLKNRDTFCNVLSSIDSIATKLHSAAKNNFKKWDILNSTKYKYHPKSFNSYNDAIEDLKDWIQKRILWINQQY